MAPDDGLPADPEFDVDPEPSTPAQADEVVQGPIVDSPFPNPPPTVDDQGRISRRVDD